MEAINQHMPRLVASGKPPTVARTLSRPSALVSPREATCQAELLLGFYRRADCSDPEVFVAGVAAALACYSPEIAAKACDPRSGLPAAIKWLPNVAEVHEFCRREASRHARAAESEARIAEQAAERERVAAAHAGQGDDERRKAFVAAELARLGELGRRSEGEPDPTQLDVRGMPEGPARRALEANSRRTSRLSGRETAQRRRGFRPRRWRRSERRRLRLTATAARRCRK